MKILLICILSLGTGCSYGPFNITHETGKLPKAHVAIPYGGKLRVIIHENRIDGLKLIWKKEFK